MSKSNVYKIQDFIGFYIRYEYIKTKIILDFHKFEEVHLRVSLSDLNLRPIHTKQILYSLIFGTQKNYNFLIDDETMEAINLTFDSFDLEMIKKKTLIS